MTLKTVKEDQSQAQGVTVGRVWGIKLGSGGLCVPFCERHHIVGISWRTVDPQTVASAKKDQLLAHVQGFYPQEKKREVGKATGQLFRFGQECKEGDYILYYHPLDKRVRICRVISEPLYRDFEPDDKTDIWHFRKVEYPVQPIPILEFEASLKGSLIGPRMSFWSMGDVYNAVHQLACKRSSDLAAAPDLESQGAYRKLKGFVTQFAKKIKGY